ncbi:MAG: hypothetical protein LBT51_06050 [Fusobacteriaceae bacterium]|jgi:hypothetical protein|nr:hypothetical protein [Fusobacteriaceae bacterium]
MYKNPYGTILKDLLSFSDIKFVVAGNHLGYDVSYISKWCSSAKLPAAKVIHEINKQLSALIGKEILDTKNATNFFNKFKLKIPKNIALLEDKKFLEEQIYVLLSNAYDESSECVEEKCFNFLTEPEEIRAFLEETIRDTVIESNKDISVFLSLDITSPGSAHLLSLFSRLKPDGIKINIFMGACLDRVEKDNYLYLKKVFFILNKFINLSIQLYNIRNFWNLNSIVIKNKMALVYSANNEGMFESIVFTKDKPKVSKTYETIKKFMSLENNFLRLKESDSLIKSAFRTSFYSNNSFNFLLSHGFEFLLPTDIMNNILDYAEENTHPYNDIVDIKKLIITLNETFEHSTSNFFILKSSILKSFQDRKIYFMNVEYEISPSEIREFYPYFIEALKTNKDINIYIIDDDKLDMGFLEFKISIYCNSNTVFLKNLFKLHQKHDDFFSVINNSHLVENVNLFFEELKKSPLCKKYSIEEIEQSWEKYKNMLFRIMDIKK